MKLFRYLLLLILAFGFLPHHHAHAAQYNPVLPTTSPYPGLTMLSNINSSFQGFLTNNAAASAPSYGVEGTLFDDSTDNYFELYTGANWVTLGIYSSTQWSPLVNGAPLVCPTSTGSSNAYIVTYSPAITALVTGTPYCWISNFSNTASATVNINGMGNKTIKKLGGTNLASGDIGNPVVVTGYYDGTSFEMTSQLSQVSGGTVTSVGTSNGICGGTFTTSGTVSGCAQSDATIMSNVSGGSASPTGNSISAVLDYLLGTTRGSIVERGATTWQALTGTTTGTVLTWKGAGNDPAYQALGSGLTLLSTVNCTSGSPCATVSFSSTFITSTYNTYLVVYDSVSAATSPGQNLEVQVSANNGGTWQTTSYKNAPAAATTYIDALNNFPLDNNSNVIGRFYFALPSATNRTIFNSFFGGIEQGGTMINGSDSGMWNSATAINAIRIMLAGDSIVGNFHLYGLSGT